MVQNFTPEFFGTNIPAHPPANVIPEQLVVNKEECVRPLGDFEKESYREV
ncbi:MAG: hypothetical protein R2824_26015 [Saprospiraceae bacterium]|nr:hypothetical protein [Lewinella sp.]